MSCQCIWLVYFITPQALDHPYLVVYSKSSELRTNGDQKCGICLEAPEDRVVSYYLYSLLFSLPHLVMQMDFRQETNLIYLFLQFQVTSCGHIFCKVCLMNFSETLGEAVCPSCSTPLTVDSTIKLNAGDRCTNTVSKGHKSSSILDKISLEDFQTSTKIEALVCLLYYNHILSVLYLRLKKMSLIRKNEVNWVLNESLGCPISISKPLSVD